MICSNCTSQNQPNADFCASCGAPLNNIQEIQPNNIQNTFKASPQNPDMLNNIQNTSQSNFQDIQTNNTNQINNTSNEKSKQPTIKTILLIIFILIISVVIGFIIYKYFLNQNNQTKESTNIYENNLILVKENGKYGFINTDGDMVIKAQYDKAEPFKGNYTIGIKETTKKIGEGEYVYEQAITTTDIIDKKGNVKKSLERGTAKYVKNYDLWIITEDYVNYNLYNGNLKKISADYSYIFEEDYGYFKWEKRQDEKRQAGIINYKGKVTYTYDLKEGESIYIRPSDTDDVFKEHYCGVSIENLTTKAEKDVIVNCDTGKVIYDYTDNKISVGDNNIFEIYDKNTEQLISQIYIQNNKIIYQTDNKDIDLDYSNGYITIEDDNSDNEKYSYIDVSTGKIIESKIDYENEDIDLKKYEKDNTKEYFGYTEFKCDKGYGIKNKNKIIIECNDYYFKYLEESLYKYLKTKGKKLILEKNNNDKKYYLINLKDGTPIKTFDTDKYYGYNSNEIQTAQSTFIYNSGYATEDSYDKYSYYFYNLKTGEEKEFTNLEYSSSIHLHPNYLTIQKDGNIEYYNDKFKLFYTEKKESE